MIVKGWFRPQLQTINKFYAEFDLLTYFACMFNLIWLITTQTNITKINKCEKKKKKIDYKEKTLLGKKTLGFIANSQGNKSSNRFEVHIRELTLILMLPFIVLINVITPSSKFSDSFTLKYVHVNALSIILWTILKVSKQ